jgi:hypothetical protein
LGDFSTHGQGFTLDSVSESYIGGQNFRRILNFDKIRIGLHSGQPFRKNHLVTLLRDFVRGGQSQDREREVENVSHAQGDQMSLLENCPKCGPSFSFLKLIYNFYRDSRTTFYFSKNCPKKTIAQ